MMTNKKGWQKTGDGWGTVIYLRILEEGNQVIENQKTGVFKALQGRYEKIAHPQPQARYAHIGTFKSLHEAKAAFL